jgi:hypothetical protein
MDRGTRPVHHPVERDQVGRAVGIVLLLAVALVHLLDSIDRFSETPYIFWLYMALMAATLLAAVVLLRLDSKAAWAFATIVVALTIVAFIWSRTVGLPGSEDDIGNWAEPLGVAALFVEGCLVALGVYKIATIVPLDRVRAAASLEERRADAA